MPKYHMWWHYYFTDWSIFLVRPAVCLTNFWASNGIQGKLQFLLSSHLCSTANFAGFVQYSELALLVSSEVFCYSTESFHTGGWFRRGNCSSPTLVDLVSAALSLNCYLNHTPLLHCLPELVNEKNQQNWQYYKDDCSKETEVSPGCHC